MSLKYGLNFTKKTPASAKRAVFDDDDDDDPQETALQDGAEQAIDGVGTSSRPGNRTARPVPNLKDRPKPKALPNAISAAQDSSALRASQAQVKAAEELDASIFDYDSFHDAKTSVTESKKAVARQDAIERKPKYINNLLDAAARRKQDQQVAREKFLQREREAEGDEFADKEKFVTGAYKLQQEENRKLEEAEQKRAEDEERRKRQMGGGMQGFYRTMMEQNERQHQEAVEAAAKMTQGERAPEPADKGDRQKSDAELAAELKSKGIDIHLNEEGQITDKRELLSAGLNIVPSGGASDRRDGGKGGADHLRSSNHANQSAFSRRDASSQQAQRERQTQMLEQQLAEKTKRAREEEEEERERLEKAAKTTKTDRDVSDAKARYLARKAAKARGEG